MKKADIIEKFGNDLEKVLQDLYLIEKMSTPDIAGYFTKHFNEKVEAGSIWLLLKDFNIPIRSISDSVSIATATLDADKVYLDNDTLKYMDGLMLSDGSIVGCGKYHRFSMGSSNKEFIDFALNKIRVVCENVVPSQAGQADYKNGRESSWQFATYNHPDLTFQYNRWYKDGVKIIPTDVSLSPECLLMWYYGDGKLVKNELKNSCVLRLSTDAFNNSSISCQRLGCLHPGALVCASSSTNAS